MKLKNLGEFNFIKRIKKGIRLSSSVVRGIGDDTAILKYTKDSYLLFTCDMLVEDTHFRRKVGGYLIGRKALSCNISDIAAMGGIPMFCVISTGIPSSLDVRFADKIYKGIKDVAGKFNINIVGGDTVSSEKIIINIALLGIVEKDKVTLRSGAKNGDVIFVTGSVGGSIKGKHLNFTPRLGEARFLVRHFKINSMIDVSDGLLADLGHILEESKKGAVIYEKDIPISKAAKNFNVAIRDGEDYELMFTLPEKQAAQLEKSWCLKTRLSKIGTILPKEKGFYLVKKDNKQKKIKPEGFRHF